MGAWFLFIYLFFKITRYNTPLLPDALSSESLQERVPSSRTPGIINALQGELRPFPGAARRKAATGLVVFISFL